MTRHLLGEARVIEGEYKVFHPDFSHPESAKFQLYQSTFCSAVRALLNFAHSLSFFFKHNFALFRFKTLLSRATTSEASLATAPCLRSSNNPFVVNVTVVFKLTFLLLRRGSVVVSFELFLNELVSTSLQRPLHVRLSIDDVSSHMTSHMRDNSNHIMSFSEFVVDKFELKDFEGFYWNVIQFTLCLYVLMKDSFKRELSCHVTDSCHHSTFTRHNVNHGQST